jgi:hypothetical protein
MSDLDHCNPFGIQRPTSTAQAIRALLGLRTLLNGALFEGEPEHDRGMNLVEWGLDALGYREPEHSEHYDDEDTASPALVVNGDAVIPCADCSELFTSSYLDYNDATHCFQCYPCRDGATDWQKDTQGNWGQAFATALGSDGVASACWRCGGAERVGDYCRGCLSMQ